VIPRLRILLLSLAAAGASALAGQAAAAPAPAGDVSHGPTTAAAEPQATEAGRRRRRSGCSRFCRQAGGFGAGPDQENPVEIEPQTVRVDRYREIGIRATCVIEVECDGAILVNRGELSYGRADLRIPAGKTRTVYVFVPRKGRRYLRRNGRDRRAYATVPLKSEEHPVSVSPRITLLPRR
jgi:hypothetical protein